MAWTGLTAAALWRWVRLGHGLWWFVGTYVVLAVVAFTLLVLTTHRLGTAIRPDDRRGVIGAATPGGPGSR